MKLILRLVPISATAILGGCSELQSVLVSAGPDAERILTLAVVLFAGAAAILLIVFGALALALGGSARARGILASSRAVVIGGLAFPVITLTVLLAYGVWVMRANITPAEDSAPIRIEITGEQWWWRIAYIDPKGDQIESANEVRVPVGREVEFVLRSADVIHSFWVPSLGGKVDMIPGRTTRLRLTAGRPGLYRGQCAEYCGGPHALMATEIVAMPQTEFDAWLAGITVPKTSADSNQEARGRDIFLAAGCGACHAVRGTPASGTLGPDLSRVGERRSLAAATLPMSRENIARFIVDGQHIKPGNTMPPFGILAAGDLDAVSAYLMSLK